MKNFFTLTAFLMLISLLSGCGASISAKLANKNYQGLPIENKSIVLDIEEAVPVNSEFIGDIKIGDSGFTTDCGYDKVIAQITNEARNAGANIIHLIEVKKPSDFGSTCFRIKAKIYRNMDESSFADATNKRIVKNKSRLPANADYALIHFYRPRAYAGSMLGYKINNTNDSIVGRLRNGEKFVFKTKTFGNSTFYGTLETKKSVIINVEKGKEYFVRCAVTIGIVLGRPDIELIENYIGMKEYEEIH